MMSATETQEKQILKHLEKGYYISPHEALKKFGCLRLSGRIYDLKQKGHSIQKRTVKAGSKSWAEYFMTVKDQNNGYDVERKKEWGDYHDKLIATGFGLKRMYADDGCLEDKFYLIKFKNGNQVALKSFGEAEVYVNGKRLKLVCNSLFELDEVIGHFKV